MSIPTAPSCYRHPARPTYLRCTRCDRPICPDCTRSAAVGHQCADCVQAGARTVRQPRLEFGGRPVPGPPLISYALIALNVIAFVLQTLSRSLQNALVLWAPAVADGQLYRLVTSAFLHYGASHLLLNMWALYLVGPPLEARLGRIRFGALYLLSALGGAVLVYLISPLDAATAGASGAVFGLFGATFVVANRLNLDLRWVVGLIVINLLFTVVVPNISWQGHLGGLLTGALTAAAYVHAPSSRRNLLQAGATVLMLALFAALIWWRTTELLGMFTSS